jgi:uncharacterized protein (DUF427 family)
MPQDHGMGNKGGAMSDITITPSDATWIVRANGAILAETRRAKELREGAREPVVYIPREDVAMALFEPSQTATTCPRKGQARHFSFIGPDGEVRDAAWSYEAPADHAAAIAGHIAFYPNKVKVQRA